MPYVYRGQRSDQRLLETAETCVVWLIPATSGQVSCQFGVLSFGPRADPTSALYV
jgi:hypothetical protein